MGYIANEALPWGDRVIMAGELVPDGDPDRRYDIMLDTGQISVSENAPVAVASPIPANLGELSKDRLFALASELGVGEVEGSGFEDAVLKKDLIKALESVRPTLVP